MSEQDAFLAAIAAAPGDDTPRLVYADWLDDSGDRVGAALQRVLAERHEDRHRLNYADAVEPSDPARAEFVRVQVELATTAHAKMPPYYDGSTRSDCRSGCPACKLERREAALFDALEFPLGGDIRAAVPRMIPFLRQQEWITSGHGELRRGFVAKVACPAADWLAHGDAICAAHPVERVRLTGEIASGFVPPGEFLTIHAGDRHSRLVGYLTRLREYPHLTGDLRADQAALLAAVWPGVAFDLPGSVAAHGLPPAMIGEPEPV